MALQINQSKGKNVKAGSEYIELFVIWSTILGIKSGQKSWMLFLLFARSGYDQHRQ